MYTFECVYENYFGETVKEAARFQLSRPEIFGIEASKKGGFVAAAEKMKAEHDETEIFANFQNIIALAYGEISPDGRRFVKSPELSKAFLETPIYEQLFDKLISDSDFQMEFLSGIVPKDSKEEVAKALQDYLVKGNVPVEEADS